MKVILMLALSTMTLANVAMADPEKAYQGGKAVSDSITGSNTRDVDDRDFEQRMHDAARDAGRRAGESSSDHETSDSRQDSGNEGEDSGSESNEDNGDPVRF